MLHQCLPTEGCLSAVTLDTCWQLQAHYNLAART
jgi:hypothetical protein